MDAKFITNASIVAFAARDKLAKERLKPDAEDLLFLAEIVLEQKPGLMIEFGSGYSTAVITSCMRSLRYGHLITIDESEMWQEAAIAALPPQNRAYVTRILAGSVLHSHGGGYSALDIPHVVPDILYVDGPDMQMRENVPNISALNYAIMAAAQSKAMRIIVDGRIATAKVLRGAGYEFRNHKLAQLPKIDEEDKAKNFCEFWPRGERE